MINWLLHVKNVSFINIFSKGNSSKFICLSLFYFDGEKMQIKKISIR